MREAQNYNQYKVRTCVTLPWCIRVITLHSAREQRLYSEPCGPGYFPCWCLCMMVQDRNFWCSYFQWDPNGPGTEIAHQECDNLWYDPVKRAGDLSTARIPFFTLRAPQKTVCGALSINVQSNIFMLMACNVWGVSIDDDLCSGSDKWSAVTVMWAVAHNKVHNLPW